VILAVVQAHSCNGALGEIPPGEGRHQRPAVHRQHYSLCTDQLVDNEAVGTLEVANLDRSISGGKGKVCVIQCLER